MSTSGVRLQVRTGAKWGSGAQATLPHRPARAGPWAGGRRWVWNMNGAQGGLEVVHLSKVELTCPVSWMGAAGLWVASRPVGPWTTSPQQGRPVAGRGPRGPGVNSPPETTPAPAARTVRDLGSWGERGGKFPRGRNLILSKIRRVCISGAKRPFSGPRVWWDQEASTPTIGSQRFTLCSAPKDQHSCLCPLGTPRADREHWGATEWVLVTLLPLL